MKCHSFQNVEGYNKHLASQFRRRKASLSRNQFKEVLEKLNFYVDTKEIATAHYGNISRVFLTADLAIKIRERNAFSDQSMQFVANKIASDSFYPKLPVVNVLAYDHFEKTDYEVLVMEKAKGKILIEDYIYLDKDSQKQLFGQILDICNETATLTFNDWGNIKDGDSYATFEGFLGNKINQYCQRIIDKNLASTKDIYLIKDYFLAKLNIFDDEITPAFAHTDINIANVLYNKDHISLLFDFDSAVKGPKYMMLPKIISSIDNLGEIVDGTRFYEMYRNKKFQYLYPIVWEKMADILKDKKLSEKLNLILIYRGLRLVAENRFEAWNKVIIQDIIKFEIVKERNQWDKTYYSQILKKMGC